MGYFSDMEKTSFRDFFRLPELALLLVAPLLPFGVLKLMLVASWLLHVWLRQGDKGRTSSGRRAQVIVTVACWLTIVVVTRVVGAANFTPASQDNGLPGIVASFFKMVFFMAALWPVYLLILLSLGVFLLAQFSFWVVGIRRLWRTRKVVGIK